MTDRTKTAVTSWQTVVVIVATLAMLLGALALTEGSERAVLLVAIGAVGTSIAGVLPSLRRIAPLALALFLAPAAAACSPTTLQLHARVYAFAAVSVEASQTSLVRVCTVLRDDCASDAACLERARSSCTDAATAQDAARDAVDLYDRIIVAASLAGGDAGVMAQVLQALDIAVTAWGALGRTLGAVGAPLPDLPAWATGLLASAVPGAAS